MANTFTIEIYIKQTTTTEFIEETTHLSEKQSGDVAGNEEK